ncbi:hypothetical protein KXX57_002142 [Aspergillus fumigatus]|nr:hypothetical protein KXX57_002142 [Aspergillus fumigatus]KAH2658284.1 hypothetical protein KXV32_001721 [Aspergillus fumigatus]KAH2912855.1 hypothetical protein KXW25_001522 [Aspergillus fumigatus]
MCTPGGSYVKNALSWNDMTFHLPKHISFEETVTIPLAALTVVVSLYGRPQFPPPWRPVTTPIPFIVYDAIKLARNSNVHPNIAIAGKDLICTGPPPSKQRSHSDRLPPWNGDHDQGDKGLSRTSWTSYCAPRTRYLINLQSAEGLKQSIAPGGQVDFVLPNDFDVSPAIKSITSVGSVHKKPGFGNHEELGFAFSRYFTRALQNVSLPGHPFEVGPQGLEGVEEVLKDLKAGKARAPKYIFRIADTPGIA